MATDISELLDAAAPPCAAVVRGITDDQLYRRTPCAEYNVRDLLNHLFKVVINFQALAARQAPDWTTTPDYLDGEWRDRFAQELTPLIAAWSDPAALEGVSPGMGLPQRTVGHLILLDLAVHGWDLARATGQPFTTDPAVVTALHGLVTMMGPQARQTGVFAAPVTAPESADSLARLVALTGRDPSWRATADQPGR